MIQYLIARGRPQSYCGYKEPSTAQKISQQHTVSTHDDICRYYLAVFNFHRRLLEVNVSNGSAEADFYTCGGSSL